MAETWIALMTRCRQVGWTSKLKGGPFAAWVKLLMTVKDCGKRGGTIRIDYLDTDWLRKNNVTLSDWSTMLAAAVKDGAITEENGLFTISKWDDYQRDPTGAKRQAEWKKRRAENGSNVSNGSNGNHTGQDHTEQDRTEQEKDLSGTVLTFPTKGEKKSWNLTQEVLAHYQEIYPDMDVLSDLRRALGWVKDNPTRRKTARGMRRFLGAWLGRANDSGKYQRTEGAGHGRKGQAVAGPSAYGAPERLSG